MKWSHALDLHENREHASHEGGWEIIRTSNLERGHVKGLTDHTISHKKCPLAGSATQYIAWWFYLSWHFTMWCQVYDDYLQYKLIIYDDKDDIEEWDVGRLEYRLNGRHVCEDCLLVLQTECPVSTVQNIARLFTIPNPALLLRSPSVEIGRPTSRNSCQVTFLQSIFSIQS